MAYTVPDLPYPYEALEPHIDAETMRIHHDKHHAAYVDKLNAALDGTEWMGKPIETVLADLDRIPEDKRTAVRNNGGGHANHTLFWEIMSPNGGGEPTGAIAEAIESTFGAFDVARQQIVDAGINRFGSGWTWLIWDGTGLAVVSTTVAFIYYYRLIADIGPVKASTVTLLVPVFGMIWGVVFLGEPLTPGRVAGCAIILLGCAMILGLARIRGRTP